ncbi:hypothetical protein [Virgibacillus alimentarius]|uniref:hypothetical protein n=1 Tax=Virgibacillus alimentarius TaxID=698769 RepID=UPI0004932E20|nr:hypothetical protein [Virgibacillus alimentarius]
MFRKGVNYRSRKQSDFVKRMNQKDREDHLKSFIASCESDMLMPYIQIKKHDKHFRKIEYEVDIPDQEELMELKRTVQRYKRTLEEFANRGTKHDLNPTLVMDGNECFKLLDYIQSMDDYVRQKAHQTLEVN